MRLRYTLPALADLEAILDYVRLQSPQGALRIQRRLQIVSDLIKGHPMIGSPTDDPTIRRLTATPYPYLVFYEARPSKIVIHAIRHSARDPSDMPG